jgi:CMP-N,N'-diacetyllegionaminic acid synthase
MENFLLTICARGGSKGVPGKNIKPINGLPLIAYSIRTAQAFAKKHTCKIALSTDSDEIIKTAAQFGLHTEYKRPDELATDTAGKIGVIKHVKEYEDQLADVPFDYVIDLDITSPLRTVEDIENALKLLQSNTEAHNIFSVSPANRNPYFNMVEDDGKGFVKLIKDGSQFKSRQEAPKVYDMNASFYIFRPSFFDHHFAISITDKSLAYVVPHSCFDIDHPIDFTILELMLRENLLDFKLD